MSDKRFEIAPPDRDGRRCVCEWLEITREGERHVFEYFREHMPAPEAASAATPSDAAKAQCDIGAKTFHVWNDITNATQWDELEPTKRKMWIKTLRTFAEALRDEKLRMYAAGALNTNQYEITKIADRAAIANLLGPEVKS